MTSRLQISASTTTRDGSKCFFRPDEPGRTSSSVISTGYLWKSSSTLDVVYSWIDGLDVDIDDDDDDDDSDDDESVQSYQRQWTIALANPPRSDLHNVVVLVDVPMRVFVRTLTTSNDATVATVVVHGDAESLVETAVVVVEETSAPSSALAFRVTTASTAPLAGRLLVHIHVNINVFSLSSLRVNGNSVVVVDDSLVSNAEAVLLSTSERAQLFVSLDNGVQGTNMTLRTLDASSLVLQSRAPVIIDHVNLQQDAQSTLVVVTERFAGQHLTASATNRLCLHTVDRSALSTVATSITGNNALVEWTASVTAVGAMVCDMLDIRVDGQNARTDIDVIQSGRVNVSVTGRDAVVVVNAPEQLVYAASPDARGVVYTGPRPRLVQGNTGQVNPVTVADKAFAAASPCALATLVRQYPLPRERAGFVTLPLSSPAYQQPAATMTLSPPIPLAAPDDGSTFVSGSLHMLGSMPYLDAIVVFLISAWILHHLLGCYDRRRRRRAYREVNNANDDRVWI